MLNHHRIMDLSALRRAIECPICLDTVADRFLSCGHSICIDCLPSLQMVSSKCPVCRKPVARLTDASQMPINYTVRQIHALFHMHSKVWCTRHPNYFVSLWCIDCLTPLCQQCNSEGHSRQCNGVMSLQDAVGVILNTRLIPLQQILQQECALVEQLSQLQVQKTQLTTLDLQSLQLDDRWKSAERQNALEAVNRQIQSCPENGEDDAKLVQWLNGCAQ